MATTLALLSLVIQVLKAILGFLLCPILLHYPQKIISLCSSVIFRSEAHPDMIRSDGVATPENYQKDLEYLKRKVDAGADLIITQLFYDTDIFPELVNDCRQIGINCPIVPGIMPINNYKGFLRMTGFCKTKVCIPPYRANRPKSYISRTLSWEQYPHDRWEDSCNPSYRALADYQFMRARARDKKLHDEWATPLNSIEDILEKFKKHCLGKLKSSPWSELDGLQPETKIINEQLGKINLKGFLTINSQPAVNGERSDSPSVGGTLVSNVGTNDVNVVTWGVFPAKQIIQPTVVDPASFNVWKDEAFEIWSRGWASLYPEDDPSRKLLEGVQSGYFLVSLVDNDYIHGDIFAVFADL
ncbi:hypothetical protein GH714_043676 [Hevea brasiliensis]|uniref:Methylenetetrahydrofolate reductase n=1 Tax=Hevea brasiliensis TaxID=3981 RepID=A0A6A6K1Q8_HEVBR|nr:hypothetical protein GH714_043676 [Hevea brasiliensis]